MGVSEFSNPLYISVLWRQNSDVYVHLLFAFHGTLGLEILYVDRRDMFLLEKWLQLYVVKRESALQCVFESTLKDHKEESLMIGTRYA